MASVVIAGDTSGTVTLAAPAVAGTTTLTLPTANGTLITTGSSGQSIPKAALPTGSVLQVVSATKTDRQSFTLSSGVYQDITGLSASITPTASSSKILIIFSIGAFGLTVTADGMFRIVRGSTAIGIGDSGVTYISTVACRTRANELESTPSMNFLDSPATTSSTTYKIQFMSADNCTGAVNMRTTSNVFGAASTITLMEIAA